MKTKTLFKLTLSALLLASLGTGLRADEAKDTQPAPAKDTQPAPSKTIPGQPVLKVDPPVNTEAARLQAEWAKLREEITDLPADEQAARRKEWSDKNAAALRGNSATNSLQNRALMRQDLLDKQIERLEQKKKDGTITEVETKQLGRLQEYKQKFSQRGGPGQLPSSKPTGQPAKRPQVETPTAKPTQPPTTPVPAPTK